MSKADTLLKKATFFERMALYSDRKAFLQSLAQTGGASDTWPAAKSLPADVAEGINSVMKDLAATKPDSTALQNRLQSFYEGMNTDMGQLAQALSEAANTIPGDHTTQVQNALALADKVRQMVAQPQQPGAAGDQTMYMPADKLTAYPPIDKGQQEALARFLMINGITFVDPKKLNDGKLGPETRKGLNAFKQWYNAKATGKKITSDAEALQFVKFIVDSDPKYH